MRRPVIVESPYGSSGDLYENIQYAKRALLDSIRRGEAPLASHLLYPQVLADFGEERQLGIECGLVWLPFAEAHIFYTDLGWSEGMLRAWMREHPVREVRGLDGPARSPPEQ